MAMIADERRRLADLLDTLSPEQLATPSLCGSWTVKEVFGHLVTAFALRARWAMPVLLRGGVNPHKAFNLAAKAVAERPAGELASLLRRNADNRFRLPVFGLVGQLTDVQVHGQDIRRPLDLPYDFGHDRLRLSLTFLVSGRAVLIAPRRRRAGLRFVATDLDWAWGSGPAVEGTGEAVMLALAGRSVVLAELAGDGLAVLRGRLTS
jgi:uncharacterized protein (TIGR03083 family)